MDFGYDARTQELRGQLLAFMDAFVYPAEKVFAEQVAEAAAAGQVWQRPAVIDELKAEARGRGLWNLFLTRRAGEAEDAPHLGAGLTNLQYAPLAEITGHSPHLAPEALNCAAPDTGNMEVLAEFGSAQQQQRWLRPLLDGEIRSAFCMTEPDVASSDANNISTRIERDGDQYVINGRKWWSTGAMDPRCEILIVMGKTAPDGERHRQQSMILVPTQTPGVTVKRGLQVFGFLDTTHGGHAEVEFRDVRVPAGLRVGLAHHDEDLAARVHRARRPPLPSVDHEAVAIALDPGRDVRGVRGGDVGLGHAERRADLAIQQRPQPPGLLPRAAELGEQFHVAGVRGGAIQRLRSDLRAVPGDLR